VPRPSIAWAGILLGRIRTVGKACPEQKSKGCHRSLFRIPVALKTPAMCPQLAFDPQGLVRLSARSKTIMSWLAIHHSITLYNARMNQSLRITQLETELTLLKMQISNAQINLPTAASYTKQELKDELERLNKRKQELTEELNQLRDRQKPENGKTSKE
jgi:hypothetical protein